MDFQDLGIKEVNAYYARRGGIRTAAINGYANVGSFPTLMQRTMAQAAQARESAQTQATQASATGQTGRTARTGAITHAGKANQASGAAQSRQASRTNGTNQAGVAAQKAAQTHAAVQTKQSSETSTLSQALSDNGNICCEKCQAVSQVMLQMMSKNLYAQSALGYPLTGAGSWVAYQNMANILGNSLF